MESVNCTEDEIRRLVDIQSAVDYFETPGFIAWPSTMTGRQSKAELVGRIQQHDSELRLIHEKQARVITALLLLLRKELP